MAAPFTILTGFLGAGKTTVLNRVLANPGGRRIAVLVNELGRIAIDTKLIVGASGDVLELAGGCLCCKLDLRSDLWGGIVDIIERSSPDHVILETTGIAEPPALIAGLEHFEVKQHVAPHGVVCVLDAVAGPATLETRDEARIQLQSAERALIAKLDIAGEGDVARVHAAAAALNPAAERASFPDTSVGNLAMTSWLTEKRTLRRSGAVETAHRHGQIEAATFVDNAPLVADALLAAIRELAPGLLRVKGFVHLAGSNRRGLLQLAGGRVELALSDTWVGERRTELVLIGEGVSEDAIRRRLWACRAGQ